MIKDTNKLIEENIGLVHLCANKFKGRGIEYDDLYGAGCVGLIKAAEGFDPDKGFKFSTYAVPVIFGEVKRLFRDGGSVKVSRSLKELSLKVMRMRENFTKKQGREPTISELSKLMEISQEEIIEAINVSQLTVSLTSQEDEAQIDVKVEAPEREISDKLALEQALDSLDKLDRDLIILRYFKGKTQSETGKLLNITQVQVSRKEKKLLSLLKTQLME